MKRALVFATILFLGAAFAALSQDKFLVGGYGAYPVSDSMTSMWLAGLDHRPQIMVYFHGHDGWHNTKWKTSSRFEKGKPGWAELQSDSATLRLSLNVDVGEAEVQSSNFKVAKNNTFLVLHADEPVFAQKIVPLGVFDLPASKEQPASIMLLKANPELSERIEKEVKNDQR